MKKSEAIRIPALLAARRTRPKVEEAAIEGIHMLVILGDEVDTVIRYNRSGGADMPQLSTYPEVAEAAAHARTAQCSTAKSWINQLHTKDFTISFRSTFQTIPSSAAMQV